MGSRLRLFVRLGGTFLYCAFMGLVALVLHVASIGNPRRRYRVKCKGMSIWGHGIARIWGMGIHVEGPVPRAPFYLVSNHISYTDIVLLCAVCPGWFVSKAEVASWPGIGPLTRIANTIYIDRETRRDVHRMNQLIASLVRDGGGVGFYPEGTTTDGSSVLPFKPSLLQPAVEMNLPVSVAAIRYVTRPGAPSVAWIGDEAFAPHAKRLLSGPGFIAQVRFGSETFQAPDRKQLARSTHAAVSNLLQQMRS